MGNAPLFVFLVVTLAMCLPALVLEIRPRSGDTPVDRLGTFMLYSTFIISSVAGGLHLWCESPGMSEVVGVSIYCLGAVIRILALRTLGRMYSGTVTIQAGHELIRTGIYKLVRHPLHLGLVLVMIGLACIGPTAITAPCLVVCQIFILRRNKIEDTALLIRFGQVAREYQAKVPGMNILRSLIANN